jgi:hypothetical protein
MNCPVCRNYVYDHLENLSLPNHPLQNFVRLKQLRKKLPELFLELFRFLTHVLPHRWSFRMHPNVPIQVRIQYEQEYLKSLETHSLDFQKDVETLILFLLETGIVSGKCADLLEKARQFLASQIVYFLETIPEIHNLHKKTPSYLVVFKPLQDDEEDLYA